MSSRLLGLWFARANCHNTERRGATGVTRLGGKIRRSGEGACREGGWGAVSEVVCHSERREEIHLDIRTSRRLRISCWILRCARDDRIKFERFEKVGPAITI